MELQAALAELSVKRRNLVSDIDRQPDEPTPSIRDAIHAQADMTEDLLGYKSAQMMLGWRDTYEAFLAIYQGDKRRSEKLAAMDELLKALLIDRNPAYPLFRHWYRQVEALPEEPPEPETPEPAEAPAAPSGLRGESAWVSEAAAENDAEAMGGGRRRWLFNVAALLGIVLVIGGLASLAASGSLDEVLAAILPEAAATEPAPETEPTNAPAVADAEDEAADESAPVAPTAAAEATEAPAPTDIPTEIPTIADTPAPTVIPTPALPPEGLTGAQSLLELYAGAADWDARHFSRQGATWRLGASAAGAGEALRLFPPVDLLDRSYGNDAPARIRRLEAELALHSTNAAVVSDGDIYFGILLMSADGARTAGIQVQQDAPNVISLALNRDDAVDVVSQRTVNNLITRLRLDRDGESGAVRAYFNDAMVGDPIAFVAADEGLLPVIFVKDGGVVVSVTAWDRGVGVGPSNHSLARP